MKKPLIICVDDEQIILNSLGTQLKRKFQERFHYEFAESGDEVLEILEELTEEGYVLVMIIADQIMQGIKGDELLIVVHKKYPRAIKMLLTGQAGLDSVINAINNSAIYGYIRKPWNEEEFLLAVERGLEKYSLEDALIEERNSLAQRVTEQLSKLSAANAELARAARLKDEFLANMSHELRTPLNAILGMAEALEDEIYGAINEKQLKCVSTIEKSGNHLLSLIDDILDLSKIGVNKLELEYTLVSIEIVCQHSIQLVKPMALKKQMEISIVYDPKVKVIRADERRLKQILVNLLNNAVKFTSPGKQIGLEVTGDKELQVVQFRVWDKGIGMSKEHVQQLFKPFTKVDSGTSRTYEGTGLGLALVARLTEIHGGGVAVESTLHEGSSFTISLPWKVAHTDKIDIKDIQWSLTIKNILIAESCSKTATAIRDCLSPFVKKIVVCSQENEILEEVKKACPEVIFLGTQSNWDMLKEFKENPIINNIPIIAVSSMHNHNSLISMGAADCLDKTITISKLKRSLYKVLLQSNEKQDTSNYPTILLAEDNEYNIDTFVEFFHSKGYPIILARNGREAMNRAKESKPDIILMNIRMPKINGLEVIRRLREEFVLKDTPIIAITALVMPGDREQCIEAGANDYLGKPLSLKHLLKVVNAHYKCELEKSV